MRARGIVKNYVVGTRATIELTHLEDGDAFQSGDELYTRADVPELVALELKRRGVTDPGPAPHQSDIDEARRYRRLRVIGCAPGTSQLHLSSGTVLRFTNLDAFIDADLTRRPPRWEAPPTNQTGDRDRGWQEGYEAARKALTQTGSEWTEDDYLTAEAALDHERHRGVKTEKSCHAAKVALDAVKHRLPPAGQDWFAIAQAQETQLAQLTEKLKAASAPAVEPLSLEDRSLVELLRISVAGEEHTLMAGLLDIFDRLFSRPAPVVKTADDLERIIRNDKRMSDSPAWNEALAELVRRANGGKP